MLLKSPLTLTSRVDLIKVETRCLRRWSMNIIMREALITIKKTALAISTAAIIKVR